MSFPMNCTSLCAISFFRGQKSVQISQCAGSNEVLVLKINSSLVSSPPKVAIVVYYYYWVLLVKIRFCCWCSSIQMISFLLLVIDSAMNQASVLWKKTKFERKMCQNVHLFQCCMFLLHSEIMLDQQHQQANQKTFFFLMIFAAVLKRSCDHVLVLY